MRTGSLWSGRSLLLPFHHREIRAGFSVNVRFSHLVKPAAFTLQLMILQDRPEKPDMADTDCRNNYPEPSHFLYRIDFLWNYTNGNSSPLSCEPFPLVCVIISFQVPFMQIHCGKIRRKIHYRNFFWAVSADYQSSTCARSIRSNLYEDNRIYIRGDVHRM